MNSIFFHFFMSMWFIFVAVLCILVLSMIRYGVE